MPLFLETVPFLWNNALFYETMPSLCNHTLSMKQCPSLWNHALLYEKMSLLWNNAFSMKHSPSYEMTPFYETMPIPWSNALFCNNDCPMKQCFFQLNNALSMKHKQRTSKVQKKCWISRNNVCGSHWPHSTLPPPPPSRFQFKHENLSLEN